MSNPFTQWAQSYEESVGQMSKDTWTFGIVQTLQQCGVDRGRVLDVACGTGIGFELLSEAGNYLIDGLDSCSQMTQNSKSKYAHFFLEDMATHLQSMEVGSYDAVVSGFDSINYLDENQLLSFFQGTEKVLKRNGILIFDYSSPRFLTSKWGFKDDTQELSSGKLRWRHRCVSPSLGTVTSIALMNEGNVLWEEHHVQYAWDYTKIGIMVESTGMKVDHVRDIGKNTYSPNSNTHVFLIRKHG